MSTTIFNQLLQDSQTEQQAVRVYLSTAIIEGIVSRLTTDAVELRTTEGRRCLILLQSIEAVTGW